MTDMTIAKTKSTSAKRESRTVRLNPELLKQLKHLAVDENKTVSELVEEGIQLLLRKQKGGSLS